MPLTVGLYPLFVTFHYVFSIKEKCRFETVTYYRIEYSVLVIGRLKKKLVDWFRVCLLCLLGVLAMRQIWLMCRWLTDLSYCLTCQLHHLVALWSMSRRVLHCRTLPNWLSWLDVPFGFEYVLRMKRYIVGPSILDQYTHRQAHKYMIMHLFRFFMACPFNCELFESDRNLSH